MKKQVGVEIGSYSFNKTAKTITFTDCGNLTLDNILLITNVTDHLIIYNFADQTTTGTMVNNVLTLSYDTSSMSNTDNLQIFINVEDVNDALLRRLSTQVDSLSTVDISNRQKVVVESILGTTLGRAITGQDAGQGIPAPNSIAINAPSYAAPVAVYYQPVWVGPVDQRWLIKDQARNTYANAIRSNLI